MKATDTKPLSSVVSQDINPTITALCLKPLYSLLAGHQPCLGNLQKLGLPKLAELNDETIRLKYDQFCGVLREVTAQLDRPAIGLELGAAQGALLSRKMSEAILDAGVDTSMQEISAIQKLRVGVDANEAGAMLASKWQLPRSISVVIRQISAGQYSGDYADRGRIIGAVEDFVRQMIVKQEVEQPLEFTSLDALAVELSVNEEKLQACVDKFGGNFTELTTIAESLV